MFGDSYAEALMKVGRFKESKFMLKSIELNPKMKNGKKKLREFINIIEMQVILIGFLI